MWLIGVRDLVWRRRRFVIGVIATALVFAITLVLGGVTAFFHHEASRTVRALKVDSWIVPKGVTGPFTSNQVLSDATVAKIAAEPGVKAAAGLVLFRATLRTPKLRDLNLIGVPPGFLDPAIFTSGRPPRKSGEISVDAAFKTKLGASLTIGQHEYRVVGRTKGITYLGGTGAAFMTLKDAQVQLFLGQPLIATVVTRGTPTTTPPNLTILTNDQVSADLYRPLQQAIGTITLVNVLLWIIAAGIIGAILYMSALERVKDFAVLKATGASNAFVLTGLASQAAILSLGAAAGAVLIAEVITPMFPIRIEIPSISYAVLLVTAIAVGLVGSIAGLRRALAVDPALAFGG
jgi:putative ABC transport system permease protein